jgi:hypothetical protein
MRALRNSFAVPPPTKRYCLVCQRMTRWRFNPAIKHSKCTICLAPSTQARAFDPNNPQYEEKKAKRE